MKRIVQYFYLFLFLLGQHAAAEHIEMAVYYDYGVWDDGVIAFENFLDWKGISHERITAETINTGDLSGRYQALYFPGGYAYYYKMAIDQNGVENIKDFVRNGGGYLGICAGAYFACDSVIWEEDGKIDYPLDLFDGLAVGAIDAIAPWDDYTMTTVNLHPDNPINQFEPSYEIMLYYGGPYFSPHATAKIDTVGGWAVWHDEPAIINFTVDSGRVLLIGPHPEIEEDLDRDSTDFAQELEDAGSDWPFLWSAVDWLLGRPISYPDPSGIRLMQHYDGELKTEPQIIYPNPFNARTTIGYHLKEHARVNLCVYDLTGRLIAGLIDAYQQPGYHRFHWHAENQSSGVYICLLSVNGRSHAVKMMLIR